MAGSVSGIDSAMPRSPVAGPAAFTWLDGHRCSGGSAGSVPGIDSVTPRSPTPLGLGRHGEIAYETTMNRSSVPRGWVPERSSVTPIRCMPAVGQE